ncbi:MAG: phage integrase family protein [Anaerolineales bacterium]|nr:phage integrase family protein [Anaerolineales bacterium]
MLNTGLRAEEVCSLVTSNLEISERKGEVLVQRGKGRKQRRIPLNKQARQALSAWLEIRLETEASWIFTGQRGDAFSTSALRRIISALAYSARLDPDEVSPHSLRHTFAKRLVDQEVSLEKVAALLGHSNLNTTRICLTPGQGDLEKTVEVLEY